MIADEESYCVSDQGSLTSLRVGLGFPLPSGSVATLAILGVERILLPDELSSDEPDLTKLGALLAQHGNCRLVPGPGPDDWSFTVGSHESS